jgi:hypothetical protein
MTNTLARACLVLTCLLFSRPASSRLTRRVPPARPRPGNAIGRGSVLRGEQGVVRHSNGGIREAIEGKRWHEGEEQAAKLGQALEAEAAVLDQAAELLEGIAAR